MENFEYVVYVLTGLFCVLTLLVAACIILLTKCWNKLETIYKAIVLNVEVVDCVRRDVKYNGTVVDAINRKIDEIDSEELLKEFFKFDPDEESSCKSADEFIDNFLAGKYDDPEPGEVVELDEREMPKQGSDDLPIHMISRAEYMFGNCHEYSKHILWYDTIKNVIRVGKGLFGHDGFTPDTATFLGDGLRYFGVSSENKDVVYIRNHHLKADFMVEKASVV